MRPEAVGACWLAPPSRRQIVRGQRMRRVWAELWRAQLAGKPAPSTRALAARCDIPSNNTVSGILDDLARMGVIDVLGRHEPDVHGVRRAIDGAIRVRRPFGVEWYE